MDIQFSLLPKIFVIAKSNVILNFSTATSSFYSVMFDGNNYHYLCEKSLLELDKVSDISDDWRCLKINGTLDFYLSGILHKAICPFAENNISILVQSSYDTDFIFIQSKNLELAMDSCKNSGIRVEML